MNGLDPEGHSTQELLKASQMQLAALRDVLGRHVARLSANADFEKTELRNDLAAFQKALQSTIDIETYLVKRTGDFNGTFGVGLDLAAARADVFARLLRRIESGTDARAAR